MIISCPSCSAEYQVPDAASTRRVRCARCATEWVPATGAVVTALPKAKRADQSGRIPESSPPVTPEPEFDDSSADSAVDKLIAEAQPSRLPRVSLVSALWALSALVIAGGAAAAYVERGSIMEAWPPSIRVYASLGL